MPTYSKPTKHSTTPDQSLDLLLTRVTLKDSITRPSTTLQEFSIVIPELINPVLLMCDLLLLLDNGCIAVPSVLFTLGGHKLVLQCVLPISFEINQIIIIIIIITLVLPREVGCRFGSGNNYVII